jgi:hypothetical protein
MKRPEGFKSIEKKMPAHTDRYIRAQTKVLYENQPQKRSALFSMVAIPALAASFFIALNLLPVQAPGANQSQMVLAAATEVFQQRQTLKDGSIHHQKFTISEGQDKAAFIAATTDLSLAQAQQVPLRTDTVEYWHHSHTRKADIASNIEAVDQGLYMVLESEDHIHIFHDPESLNKDRTLSDSRVLFDNVHNLSSHYDQYKAFQPVGPENWPETLTFVETKNTLNRYRQSLDAKHIDWLINQNGKVVAQEIYVYHDSQPFQMAVINFLGETFVAPTEFAEVFDPAENEFTQTDIFPLSEASI